MLPYIAISIDSNSDNENQYPYLIVEQIINEIYNFAVCVFSNFLLFKLQTFNFRIQSKTN